MSADTNQGTTSKSGVLESVKNYIYNGEDEDKWNKYSIKTSAFAETKELLEGLTNENNSQDIKKKEKSCLTMSLTENEFQFLNCSREPQDVWDALEEKFTPMEEGDRYEFKAEFTQCKMVDQYGNQRIRLNQLDEINTRIGNKGGGKYTQTDEYETSRERLQQGYNVIQKLCINDIEGS